MAEDVSRLIFEHVRHIRRAVDGLWIEMGEVKTRLNALEAGVGRLQAQMGDMQIQMAVQNGRMDRMEERLGRIEHRFDLAEV